MLSKGQGRTMGSYFTLLNALAEDGRLDEAEELWTKLFMDNLESTPRIFFDKMISIYHKRGMHEKMFEVSLCLLFLYLFVLISCAPILLYVLYMNLQIILFFHVPFPLPWGQLLA
jgi:pentatricopeptide repeat protein